MQRKPGLSQADRKTVNVKGEPVLEVEQAPVWRSVPFMLMVMLIVCGAIYCGRGEVWNAYVGAKAYMSKNLWGKARAAMGLSTSSTVTKTPVTLPDGKIFELWNEPIPDSCNAEQHADYDGYAVQWGLGHFARSAAECCRLCQDFQPREVVPHTCNTWVWCGDPSGTCWTPDIHTHHTGSCWLKYQETPKANSKGEFPAKFRNEHKTAPLMVPQVAGVLNKKDPAPARQRKMLA